MKTTGLMTLGAVTIGLVAAMFSVDRAIAQEPFADPRAVIEFQRAADAYAFLHRQVERRIGTAHRRAGEAFDVAGAGELAAAIAAERSGGAVLFTPAVAAAFREAAIAAVQAGCDAGELRTGAWDLFHERHSPAAGTRPVSACIAKALPRLPDELEYRSAGTVLLIVDPHANLVVDVLPGLLAGSEIR